MSVTQAPELLVFMSVALAPELAFFMAPAPALASVRFYTLIFSIVLVCLKLNGKLIQSSRLHISKRTYQTFLSNIIWYFLQPALLPGGNQRKNNNHRFRRYSEQLLAET